MKKITFLLLTILYCVVGYSQFPQNFEDPAVTVPSGFPTGWMVTDNGVGTVNSWTISSSTSVVIAGTKSAYMNREEIGAGNTSQDWLISPPTVIPTNGQLRFMTKQALAGDNGTIYQIRIAPITSPQGTLGSYTVLKQWTEAELNNVYNVAEEKVVDFPAGSAGTSLYIAFVRLYTQPAVPSGPLGGDRWSVDDINVVQKCVQPLGLTASNIAATSASLSWSSAVGSQGYDIGIIPANQTFAGVVTGSSTVNNYPATGLTQNTAYKYYVRSNCGNGNLSEWVGPFNFSTLAIGTTCSDPIVIDALPYQTTDNTGNYGNTLAGPQLTSCISGGVNYQSGNDVFYSYTATENCSVSFTLDPTQSRSSMFIYPSCAGLTGACLAGIGNTTAAPRILNYGVTAGVTYIIVISSNNQSQQTVGYNLLIQCEGCTAKPTALTVNNIGLNSADFSWTAAPGSSVIGYEVAVQSQGVGVPQGAGVNTGSAVPGYTPTNLTAATLYEYWVRAECSPGVFSAWAGPLLFNTQLCAPADQCTYIFRMTDSANNGWGGARMQIRQNGIVLATIGVTYPSGAGPVDVPVTVCNNVPFDIFWITGGTQPEQCIVSVINSFGQTIASVSGATATVGTSIYQGIINCSTALCNLAPTNVTVSSITTTGGTINWTAPATENLGFDIYIVAAGSAAPFADTLPTYSGVNGAAAPFSFSIPVPNSLTPDTSYDVYVRVQCASPTNSPWSVVKTFKTLPTCPKPTGLTAIGITTTSAVLSWSEAASATQWEVLLLPAPNAVAPAAPGITITPGAGTIYIQNLTGATTITPTNLAPATIYYYYVRAVCQPGDDASTWTGPIIFNTVTCDVADKCNFKFILTNTTNSNWNGGRIQVRQNGIVVATLGTGGINNANGITVALCNNAPFDLFWSIAGTLPEGIGFTVIDANLDVIFTKLPGVGTPLSVLFSDITLGNCLPPSCPKPTNLLVNSVTQSSANLSWTETGTATSWEVYVVEEGGDAPINGSPLNTGLAGYYIADTNLNFNIPTVPGLTPGTKYQYYVRAICSTTEISTWTLLTPKSFITKPINDECSAAIPVPVNTTQVCSQTVQGNTLGGTASAEISTCQGSENDDVWFSFVATSNIHIISLSNIVGSTTDIRFAVYAGADCGTASQIFCSTGAASNNGSVLTNLTPDTVYRIRVYTNGNNVNLSASFNVCVSTPPAPGSNDEVVNAIPITVNVLSECAYVTPGNLIGATASPGVSNTCVGTENDDVWFSFVAPSTTNVITLLNVAGTTTNINHAVYSGTPGNLVNLYCSAAGSLTSTSLLFVIGQTYYIRVYSNGSNNEVVTFNVCVKPVSTCGNAAPFCGGTAAQPYIFANSIGLPSAGTVACLISTPNPTYYTLHVGQTGPINYTMVQNTNISPTGQLLGTNLDVDFVAWGPFTSTDSCDEIVFAGCGGCPSNTTPNYYPIAGTNIIDCSYSPSYSETITIPNAQEGEFYIILITNYIGQAGYISLVQTNFDDPNAGTTICCDVNLGNPIVACSTSVTLNALEAVLDLNNVPVTFQWYFNDVLIPNENNSTIEVTESGMYTVKGNCGVNPVESSVMVTLSPPINVVSPADYEVCDVTPLDGFAPFNLNSLTPQVLGTLDSTLYNVSYYENEVDAIAASANAIDLAVDFTNTVVNNQTIYIRVESNLISTCFAVVPVNLVVKALGNADFSYSATSYCKTETPNPTPIYNGGAAGTFTFTPDGLVLDADGVINLETSAPGTYTITNTIVDNGPCGDVTSDVVITINAGGNAVFTYPQTSYCLNNTGTVNPILSENATIGIFTATPDGLVINASTGVITLAGSAAGVYEVSNEVAGQGTCPKATEKFTITIFTPANATITYDDPFCATGSTSEAVTITGTTGGTFSSTSGLTIDINTGSINPSTSSAGNYVITYEVDNGNVCGIFTTTTDVTISKEIAIDFTQGCDNNAYKLVAVPFNGSFDVMSSQFVWTGPKVIATATANEIILGLNGIYTVTVTNAEGCSATETISVNNISCTIQKGISPNNDGDNDFFDLRALNVKELFIYNRYGTEVYKYGTYTNQWKGQSNSGKELPDGTYFYVIHTVEGDNITGWIFINR